LKGWLIKKPIEGKVLFEIQSWKVEAKGSLPMKKMTPGGRGEIPATNGLFTCKGKSGETSTRIVGGDSRE